MLYVQQITRRKQAEWGTSDSAPMDEELLEVLEVIETVKAERRMKWQNQTQA
jgi:hypothetical protein